MAVNALAISCLSSKLDMCGTRFLQCKQSLLVSLARVLHGLVELKRIRSRASDNFSPAQFELARLRTLVRRRKVSRHLVVSEAHHELGVRVG